MSREQPTLFPRYDADETSSHFNSSLVSHARGTNISDEPGIVIATPRTSHICTIHRQHVDETVRNKARLAKRLVCVFIVIYRERNSGDRIAKCSFQNTTILFLEFHQHWENVAVVKKERPIDEQIVSKFRVNVLPREEINLSDVLAVRIRFSTAACDVQFRVIRVIFILISKK